MAGKKIFIACGFAALFAGCASTVTQTQNPSVLPEIDIIRLKDDCDEALKLAQDARMDLQIVNSKLAQINNRLSKTGEDSSAGSQTAIQDIENRLAMLTDAITELQQQAGVSTKMPKPRKPQTSVQETPTFSPTGASTMVAGNENEIYQAALKAFNDRSYNQADKLFQSLLTQYPQGPYTNNAWYWTGEIHYAQGQYAKAISAFDKVLASGQSQKSDDAQLKIGMSYIKLGKKSQAKESLTLLIKQYPTSEYISRAKKYLEEL